MKALAYLLLVAAAFLAPQAGAKAQSGVPSAAVVREILALPDSQLDYGRAKLAFDRVVDPSVNVDATLTEIDRLVRNASALAGAGASSAAQLAALRRVIYESGPWNGGRPFSYDHADPLGRNVRNKLISTYLATRRGNCVSMPILFLIAAERMGLNLALSTAPLHIFLRYIEEGGREIIWRRPAGRCRRCWDVQIRPRSKRQTRWDGSLPARWAASYYYENIGAAARRGRICRSRRAGSRWSTLTRREGWWISAKSSPGRGGGPCEAWWRGA